MNARYQPLVLIVSGLFALPFGANFGEATWMLAIDIILACVLGWFAKRFWSQLLGFLSLAVAINIFRAAFFEWSRGVSGIFEWLYSVPAIPFFRFWDWSELFEWTVLLLPCDIFACLAGLFLGQSMKKHIRENITNAA